MKKSQRSQQISSQRGWGKVRESHITKAKGRNHFKVEEVFNLLLRSKRRIEKHSLDFVTQKPFMSIYFFSILKNPISSYKTFE